MRTSMAIPSEAMKSTPVRSITVGLPRASIWLVSVKSTASTPAASSLPRTATCV